MKLNKCQLTQGCKVGTAYSNIYEVTLLDDCSQF
jgi:hypothetical protein